MESTSSHDLTLLLDRAFQGDRQAEERLYELVMPDLRRLAGGSLSRERPNHTLQATELVNRVYARLTGSKLSLRDRHHFFAVAARAMRRELVDYARAKSGRSTVSLDGLGVDFAAKQQDPMVALLVDELLEGLREAMPQGCEIVELKFFLGMTDEETAEVLGLPLRTMQLRWQDARIWLFDRARAR